MGPVELVGVVRLTRDWAEDVRLQAVLMTVAEWPGWLHLTVRLHTSIQWAPVRPPSSQQLATTGKLSPATLPGKFAKKRWTVVFQNNLRK